MPDNETKTTPLLYCRPTPLDLQNGPILVQVRDTETEPWHWRFLFSIADESQLCSYPFFARERRNSQNETRWKFAQTVGKT